jgi:hypothetical protein
MTRFASLLAGVTALVLYSSQFTSAQSPIAASDLERLHTYEDSLIVTADSMAFAALPEERLQYVFRFVRQLKSALAVPNSFAYPFDTLSQRINIISPDDKAFRIFNWSFEPNEATRRYYGAIQLPGESLKLYGLVDHSAQIQKGASDSILTGGRWFGALYYRVMPVQTAQGTAYTLFGLNGANTSSNRKVLDVLTLTPSGPVFGAPIFGVRSPDTKAQAVRFVMEYKKGIQAALNWNAELNAIFFDRLESEVSDPNRKYTYVPTGQYDGFRWQDGQWRLVQDLIPITLLRDGEQPLGGRD